MAVRTDITPLYEKAKLRKQHLEDVVTRERAAREHVENILDARLVLAKLKELDVIMKEFNPTLMNIELSKHIESVVYYFDGRIELRGTYLGLFDGAMEVLSRDNTSHNEETGDVQTPKRFSVTPRQRSPLYVPNLTADSSELLRDLDCALDPERFSGLAEPFFWTETFVLVENRGWAVERAAEVAQHRKTETHAELAARFGKTIPTIRNALRIAKTELGLGTDLPRKRPRRRWAEDHAQEVAALKAETGMTVLELAQHFQKSDTTIQTAINHAKRMSA